MYRKETHDKVVGVVLKHLVILSNRLFALCLIFEFEEGPSMKIVTLFCLRLALGALVTYYI